MRITRAAPPAYVLPRDASANRYSPVPTSACASPRDPN
jgi:hypothetical protein